MRRRLKERGSRSGERERERIERKRVEERDGRTRKRLGNILVLVPWKMNVEGERAAGTTPRSILPTEILRVFIRTNTIMKFRPTIPVSLVSVR